jgi:hypothetical protein
MDPVTLGYIAAVGSVASAGGQAYFSHEASQASNRAEQLRKQQMQLEADRKRRETIRQAIVAQSLATARQTAQGVSQGSSVIGGAFGQIAGVEGRDINFTTQSEQIGSGIFAANADQTSASSYASLFQQTGNLSTALFTNAEKIGRIGTNLFRSNIVSDPYAGT